MSEETAKSVAMATFLAVTAIVGWDSLKRRKTVLPEFKVVTALAILAAAMAVGVDIAPEIFGPLVLLVGLSIVIARVPGGVAK